MMRLVVVEEEQACSWILAGQDKDLQRTQLLVATSYGSFMKTYSERASSPDNTGGYLSFLLEFNLQNLYRS